MSNQLMKHLPSYYRTSQVMLNITNVEDIEITNFKTSLDNTLNQFFIDTADYTLERWEKGLGISINNNKSCEFRRSVIKSKLRGQGTITVSLIKNVAQSYNNGEIDVVEHNEEYYFTVKFIARDGVPENLTDLKNAIEEIKPAHLEVVYEFKYLNWDKLNFKNITWNELDQLNLTWDIFETGTW